MQELNENGIVLSRLDYPQLYLTFMPLFKQWSL
jgi:hypothetical protein